MRRVIVSLFAAAAATLAACNAVGAESRNEAAASGPPRLIVAISVDQFSADLFAQYRRHFTGGLARMQDGAVFPSGFQSHAATETCPGHATILTGARPSRTGIIGNHWFDPGIARAQKRVYCSEDVTNPASGPFSPVVSARFLRVPTLGDRLKAADSASRNVAVSGKDRSVVMMGGHAIDAGYWWRGKGFGSFAGITNSPAVEAENAAAAALITKGAPAMALPAWCKPRDRGVALGQSTIGQGRFPLAPKNMQQFSVSPRLDAATAALAVRLVDEQQLGRDAVTDVLSVSFSATDLIGHGYGSQGTEMCIQLAALDATLGKLFAELDKRKIDYVAVLTADHGAPDVTERLDQQGYPQAIRIGPDLSVESLALAVSEKTGIAPASGPLLYAEGVAGDIYVTDSLPSQDKAKVIAALAAHLKAHPLVAAVFTAQELADTPLPAGSPQDWSLRDRSRASFDAERSGDLVVLLDRGVMPMAARPGLAATHGSAWDYDRRVPILFWRRGMAGFEQPAPIETVDIAPTLAALIGLKVDENAFDGRCLDLDGGKTNTCGPAE